MQQCNQCGKCCLKYGDEGLSASAEDIEGWELFNPDIAAHVVNGEIWMDPVSGQRLKHCPWLEEIPHGSGDGRIEYGCRIYKDRPEDCRHYPTSISEMISDGCEMIEVRDLQAPERAQQELDELMADSRPPLSKPRATSPR